MPSREEKAWQHFRQNRELRRVLKHVKRNRKAKRVRPKNWMPDDWDDLDVLDHAQRERIMPLGERERRRQVSTAALETQRQEAGAGCTVLAARTSGQRGRVIEVSSGLCRVDIGGRCVVCAPRGTLSAWDTGFTNVVAVGDEVVISLDGADQGAVEAVLPRRSALTRPDVFHSHLQQVIVANVDQLLAVSSWREPALWFELVDRYVIAAQRNGLQPVVCLNKVDLAADPTSCRMAMEPYQQLGYCVVFTSARTGEGVSELREILRGRTTVLAGLSGVGKSSLLMAVQPDLRLRTGEVSVRRHEGRHTTSQVTMLRLQMGGFVVDTPGIREFGLTGLRRADLDRFYPEIHAAAKGCRFADCSHGHEPGCAVRVAVGRGAVAKERYDSYCKIRATLQE